MCTSYLKDFFIYYNTNNTILKVYIKIQKVINFKAFLIKDFSFNVQFYFFLTYFISISLQISKNLNKIYKVFFTSSIKFKETQYKNTIHRIILYKITQIKSIFFRVIFVIIVDFNMGVESVYLVHVTFFARAKPGRKFT